jgi:hypothetical protein
MSEKFEVGGFAYYSWGYDQTNVDWFKVVKRNDKSVWFVPVPAQRDYSNSSMSGNSVPVDKPILTKVDWKMVDGDYQQVEMPSEFRKVVKVRSWNGEGELCGGDFGNIYPWDGKPKFFSEWA